MDGKFKVSIFDHLNTVRRTLGDEYWKAEITKLAIQAFQVGGKHEALWRGLLQDLKPEGVTDWPDADELKKHAEGLPKVAPPDMNQLLAQAMKMQMPGLKSQGQYNAFRATVDAFRAVINAILEENLPQEQEMRKVLDDGFLAVRQATTLTRQLTDVPEASTSPVAEEFKRPPAEFQEYDIQRQLLAEVGKTISLDDLKLWYKEAKPRLDRVKSQTLRDVLLDAIRAKKMALAEEPTT
jgi:hypothetical protein